MKRSNLSGEGDGDGGKRIQLPPPPPPRITTPFVPPPLPHTRITTPFVPPPFVPHLPQNRITTPFPILGPVQDFPPRPPLRRTQYIEESGIYLYIDKMREEAKKANTKEEDKMREEAKKANTKEEEEEEEEEVDVFHVPYCKPSSGDEVDLYVGSLNENCPTPEHELRKIFAAYGEVKAVYHTHASSSGFVRYSTRKMAQAAIDALDGKVTLGPVRGHARPLIVKYADRIPVEFIPITPSDSHSDFELSTNRLIITSCYDELLHHAYSISPRNLSYKELDIASNSDMSPGDLSGWAELLSTFVGEKKLTREKFEYDFAGSCGGCLYFVYENENAVLLWNPTTGEFKVLPESDACGVLPPDKYEVNHCGLGFDPVSQDYKYVKAIEYLPILDKDREEGFSFYCTPSPGPFQIHLYNLSTGSWKEICCPHRSMVFLREDTVFIQGIRYWIGFNDQRSAVIVQSFNFTDETYSYFELPAFTLHRDRHFPVEYKGSFGVIIYPKFGITKCFEVWGRIEDVWVCWVSLVLEDIRKPLGFWENGRYLFLEQCSMDNVLVYDMSRKVLKVLNIPNRVKLYVQFLPHVESTVSLSNRNHPKIRYNLNVGALNENDTGEEEVNLYVGSLIEKAS